MRLFQYGKITVHCKSESTRYGFRHIADLFINGCFANSKKACYYNRTWESYEFESVLVSVVKTCSRLTTRQKNGIIKKYARG